MAQLGQSFALQNHMTTLPQADDRRYVNVWYDQLLARKGALDADDPAVLSAAAVCLDAGYIGRSIDLHRPGTL